MKISDSGYPVVILGHRKRAFLETAIQSLLDNAHGIRDIIVVDDSGDAEHHAWLDRNIGHYSVVDPDRNMGYLAAMRVVWDTAAHAVDLSNSGYALLWEEDFTLTRKVSLYEMATIMDRHQRLAQLNLQRRPVYRIERRFGYMESHQQRRYGLTRHERPTPWVSRMQPFTTNPGMIRRSVLDIEWPSREECDAVAGGAEPAMSARLEAENYYFGWLGRWNTPYTKHLGVEMKTGTGY